MDKNLAAFLAIMFGLVTIGSGIVLTGIATAGTVRLLPTAIFTGVTAIITVILTILARD